MAIQQDKLERLRELKFQAEQDGDTRKALQYDEQINQQQDFMKEYHSVMTNRIQSKTERLSQSTSFAEEILKVIEYIAINEGYSIVMDAKNPYIWWYNPEADITDLVIERLQQLARINQPN
jgi:Skp family chaperone for outer membrane proteins